MQVVALSLERYSQKPDDVENIKRLVWCAEQSGQLPNVIYVARSLDRSTYTDLKFSLVLVRYALRVNDIKWAEDVLEIIKQHHSSNEWCIIAEAEVLHNKGETTAAFLLLSEAISRLSDPHAFSNVSDAYYRLLNAPFADVIDTDAVEEADAPEVANALYVGMIKDEADVIYANLDHYYRVGFRNFVIIDNGSRDESANEIRRFRHNRALASVFIIDDPIVGYVQDSKTTAAMEFAATVLAGMGRPIGWVFAVDADELICMSSNGPTLKDVLHKLDATQMQVLSIAQINATSPYPIQDLPPGSNPLSTFTRRMAYPTLLPVFKVGARYSKKLTFDMGNHRPNQEFSKLSMTASGTEHGMFLLHFPMRSKVHVRTKILNGIAALNAAPHRVGIGGHWRQWHQQYLAKGDKFFDDLLNDYVRSIGEHDDRRRAARQT